MTQIYDLQQRAEVLRKKTATDSISPEDVGGLHADTLAYIANMERYASSLGIKKVYTSVSEMNGDESPVSSTGMPLKAGQLVTIFNAGSPDADNSGEIYAFQNPGWLLVGRLDAGTVDNLKKLIEGDKATVADNNRNAFVWLGNFETWVEAQTEIDKLHATGEDNTKVGEFRLLLNGRNLIVRNYVQNWATGVFTQTVQGSIQWNVETQTMDQSLNIKTYERQYNGTGWTTWEEGTAKIELAQELSTDEGSENKAISQKAVSEAFSQTNNVVILEWNTDAATTRKQVPLAGRKAGMQISYKNVNGKWVNEQYIGTSFTDLEWVKDENWERIVSQTEISISDSSDFNAFFSDFKIYGTLNVTDAVKIQIQTISDNVYIKAMLNGGSESSISGTSIPKSELIANTHILWEFSNDIIIEGILAKNIDVSLLTANIITKNVYYNDIYNIANEVEKVYQYNIKDVTIKDWELNTRYVYDSRGNKIEKKFGATGYSSLLIPISKGYSVDNLSFIRLNDGQNISCIVDSELKVLEKNMPKAHHDNSAYLCISKFVGSANINNPEVYEFQLGYNPSRIGDDDYVNVVWDKVNYKLDNEAGTEVAQSQCAITDFIPANENTVFLFYNLNQAYSQCVFKYDKNKSFLGFIPLNKILRYGDWYILRNDDADAHYYRFSTWWTVSQRLYIANRFNIDRICNALGIICKDVLDDYFKVTIYEGSSVVDSQNNPINDGDIIRKHQFPIIITSEATAEINKGVIIKPLYFTYRIGENTSIEENCIFVEQDVEVTYPENLEDDKWYTFGWLNWFTRKQGRRAKSLDWCQDNDWRYVHTTNKAIFKIYGFKIIDKRKELYNTPMWWLPTIGKLIKFGDSITADTNSYAGLLGKILNWTVQDATVVGYSIPAIWQRHKSSITGNYDLAIFSGGTNGGYSNPLDQPQNAEKKYSEIIRQRDDNTLIGILNSFIDKVRETNPYCPVIIINPWEPFSNFKEDDTNEHGNSRGSQWMQNKIDMQNVAVERGCLFYDTQQHIPLCPEMFSMAKDGGLHPSVSLQRLWSIEFYLWLAKMLNP